MRRGGWAARLLHGLTVATLAAACARAPVAPSRLRDDGAAANGLCAAGVDAFARTLHPYLRANCIGCHDDGGIAPPPGTKEPSTVMHFVPSSPCQRRAPCLA